MRKQLLAVLLVLAVLLTGFVNTTTFYGRVVTDTNANGIVDPSDAGIAGATVQLRTDSGMVSVAFTNSQGEYDIAAGVGTYMLLVAGLYTLPSSYTIVIGEVGGGVGGVIGQPVVVATSVDAELVTSLGDVAAGVDEGGEQALGRF